jgi:peptide/nickel transport system substrate-binding protein
MEIIEATIEGGSIPTVDPAACYDTASGELMLQVYDTLVFFDGEHLDRYLPQLATSWSIVENVPPILDPDTGLAFKWTYYFAIRTGVQWHNPAFGTLAPVDVEYTFERARLRAYYTLGTVTPGLPLSSLIILNSAEGFRSLSLFFCF